MYNIKEELKEREEMLSQLIKEKEKALKKAPDGSLRANRHGKGIQYFHYLSSDNPNGVYMKNSEKELVKKLAQKEYDQKVLKCASKEYELLKRLNKLHKGGAAEDVFEKIASMKQHLITPSWITDKMYVEEWEKIPYSGLGFREDIPELYSDKGERMRSKSELLIANALARRNIPYKYECSLELNPYGIIHPDFTVLNIKNRKEMYWEHFGLMDEEEYREKCFYKIMSYETNGYFPGDRLIMTFETVRQPLSSRTIDVVINKYLDNI